MGSNLLQAKGIGDFSSAPVCYFGSCTPAARMRERGEGVRRNEAEAFRFYAAAAKPGDARAVNAVGLHSAPGPGVARDYGQAAAGQQKALKLRY